MFEFIKYIFFYMFIAIWNIAVMIYHSIVPAMLLKTVKFCWQSPEICMLVQWLANLGSISWLKHISKLNPSDSAQVNIFSTEGSLRITGAPGMGVRSPSIIDFHRKYERIGVPRDLRHFWFVFQSVKLAALRKMCLGTNLMWNKPWLIKDLNPLLLFLLLSLPCVRIWLWKKQNEIDFNYVLAEGGGHWRFSLL